MKRIEVPPSKIGAPERGAIMLPLRGPFVILSQDITVDLTSSWSQFCEDNKSWSTETFTLILGKTIYQQDRQGGIAVAGYLHACSD